MVTGASGGIGRVIAEAFAREGARVLCAARRQAPLDDTVAGIRRSGGEAGAVVADLAVEEEVRRVMDTAVRLFGRLDALINNAGDSGPTAPIQDYSLDQWRATLDSCATSTYLCSRFAVPHLVAAGGGAIVNISSMAGRRGLAFRVGYCAAKAAQFGLTYALARELGPSAIRVNAILPAAVGGDRIDRVIAAQAELRGVSRDSVRESMIERSPLGRLVTPEDIAALALFLASDEGRSISGQCIPVTGGEPGS